MTMSVDVFGRKLGVSKTDSSRGPPGVGYKLTSDGQYDIQNKRICNLATPNEATDAVNLETLQRIVSMEVRNLIEVTSRLRRELDNLEIMFKAFRDEVDQKLININERVDKLIDPEA